MTWGPLFMYYHCPECGAKYKYELDLIQEFGESFGRCPVCEAMGEFQKEAPRVADDYEYSEVD